MTDKIVPRDVIDLALRFYEGLGGARALTLAILVRYEQWDAIAEMRCDPHVYPDAKSYAKAQAATSFLRKCADLPTSHDRHQKAIDNFYRGERDCYNANQRLERYLPCYTNMADRDPRIEKFFSLVRKTIAGWLGPRPSSLTTMKFGPGATFSDRGGKTTIPHKMSNVPSLTRDACWYLPQFLGSQWGAALAAASRDPVFVRGNRFTSVPKDATKNRGICAEPSINIFFQLGLGAELRHHLRGAGIDLDNGKDIHMRVACEASIKRHLATLDLTNASDSISKNLVKLCLPHSWYSALADLRSPSTLVEGKWVHLEKFSSMGNGYTFELETLIFAAISCAVLSMERESSGSIEPVQIGRDVYVFGDDIIVPMDGAQSVIAALRFCGLELNLEKSFFTDGPFRESCGGDFYDGKTVRPYFMEEFPHEPQQFISLANGLTKLSQNLAVPYGAAMVQRAWFRVLDHLPVGVRRLRGPKGLGDLVVHDDRERWVTKWRDGIRYVRCYRPIKHRKVSYSQFDPSVVLACATYGCGWNDGGVTPRDSVSGYGFAWVPYS